MIRQLKNTDAKDLYLLNKEQLGYDFPLEFTNKKLGKLLNDTAHHFFLGFEDESTHQLIGYVHAEVYESLYAETLFNVLALAVSKEKEKQGIGKKLMNALENEARDRHYQAIRLNSGMARNAAHKFYETIGYDHDKTQKRFIKFF